MSRSDEFRSTVRSGIRVGRPTVVVHAERATEGTAVRVGFVVSKAVGNAVVRNRIKRRLRHLVRAELASAPGGIRLVVRALPPAVTDPHALPADLERAWVRAVDQVLRMRSR